MGDVVTLAGRRDDGGPHCSGEARCIACGHEWVAVAPVGTVHFECPACGTSRGTYKNPVGAAPGDRVYQCTCGSENFFFKLSEDDGRTLILCSGCGEAQSLDSVFPS
jgi:hypothetical protein